MIGRSLSSANDTGLIYVFTAGNDAAVVSVPLERAMILLISAGVIIVWKLVTPTSLYIRRSPIYLTM